MAQSSGRSVYFGTDASLIVTLTEVTEEVFYGCWNALNAHTETHTHSEGVDSFLIILMSYQDDFFCFLPMKDVEELCFQPQKKSKKRVKIKRFCWSFECFQIRAATFERLCFYLSFGCACSLVHLPDNAAISGENVQFQCTVLLNVINRHFLPC